MRAHFGSGTHARTMMPSLHSRLDPRQISEGFLMETLAASRFPLKPLRDLAKLMDDISEDLDR